MNIQTPGKPDAKTYEFSLARIVYESVVLLLAVSFLIWAAIGPRSFGGRLSSAFIIVVALTPLYYLYLVWKSPRRVTLLDGVIKMRPWLGPERSWNSRDLALGSETTWSRLWGVREVADHEKNLQFRLTRGMHGYAELCAQLQGSHGATVGGGRSRPTGADEEKKSVQ